MNPVIARSGAAAVVACGVFAFALAGARYTNPSVAPEFAGPTVGDPAPAVVPFGVGETMTFTLSAKCCFVVSGGGDASLAVEAIDTVHGFPTYRLVLRVKGGALKLFHMDDVSRSWLDVHDLFSRRFEQKLNETNYTRDRTIEFFPSTMRWQNLEAPDDTGHLATPIPLDDVSLIYHLRTLPLTATTPDIIQSRYFKADGNPVTIRVLRTERVKVAAGEFDAIVVRPIVRAGGFFGEDGEAEVWLSNDARRIVLKMTAKGKARSRLTMELLSYTPGTPLATAPPN